MKTSLVILVVGVVLFVTALGVYYSQKWKFSVADIDSDPDYFATQIGSVVLEGQVVNVTVQGFLFTDKTGPTIPVVCREGISPPPLQTGDRVMVKGKVKYEKGEQWWIEATEITKPT